MDSIRRDIFKAIHEGKWLSIQYRNKDGNVTRYWIGILDLNLSTRSLKVEGLHLGKYSLMQLDKIFIDSILSSQVIEGSYCPINKALVRSICFHPYRYKGLFEHIANLKVLNYLEECNRMDTTPYKADYSLIKYLDRESFRDNIYSLSDEQFKAVVKDFQVRAETNQDQNPGKKLMLQQLGMNVLSIHTSRGLYVLAYRKLALDVKGKCLRPDPDITICTEFTLDGRKESIRRYLDAEDYELLKNFKQNQERIKDIITNSRGGLSMVDDMPYIIGLGRDIAVDLHREYGAVIKMYQDKEVSVPVKAFFGDLLDRPRSRWTVPIISLNQRINLDQLLAINNAMKYPVAYIQGPPGTGKTNTIINTIITAFFNEKTALFSSYNNHPIDGVVEKLTSLTYEKKVIPLPIVRLGNHEKVKESLAYIRKLYEQTKQVTVYGATLDRNREDRKARAKKLSALLKRYEDVLDLKERGETIGRLLEYNQQYQIPMQMLHFQADLQGRQFVQVKEAIRKLGEVTDAQAMALLSDDVEDLKKYLYYTSAKYIKRIDEPKNQQFKEILYIEEEDMRTAAFEEYLRDTDNMKRFLQIFPVVATTCISAHKLGSPEPLFDMTIIDEASQCNTAVSLIPIIRGKNLMLVGDPQQLNPVIILDEITNDRLQKKYMVTEEYDYRKNSIYKTFLACDSVSDEVLLRYHYRCNEKIIDFNNRKYYNSKLLIRSDSKERQPLVYVNVTDSRTDYKNTSPGEVDEIIRYSRLNKDKSIGVITPFVNQKKAIEQRLEQERLEHVSCGTVHAFQGDEKDVILFSTAITDETHEKTYQWLKNNKELINVAVSRARDQLIVLCNTRNLERLHRQEGEDDLYELIRYVQTRGISNVTPNGSNSRALGIKPFSTVMEEAFLQSLNHALENIWLSPNRFTVEKEVPVSQVFEDNTTCCDLFYTGRFDFVVYEKSSRKKYPVLVIELDGKERYENEVVMARDTLKNEICKAHQMELIRVENAYARRYQHIKGILSRYFAALR